MSRILFIQVVRIWQGVGLGGILGRVGGVVTLPGFRVGVDEVIGRGGVWGDGIIGVRSVCILGVAGWEVL